MCDEQGLRPACAYSQTDQSLCLLLEYSITVKLLTENHLKFLSLTGDWTGSPESTPAKCHIVENHMSRLKYACMQSRWVAFNITLFYKLSSV